MLFTPDQVRAGNANLLELADILDTADAEHRLKGEPAYNQELYAHECGTPACAAGHWRAHKNRRLSGSIDLVKLECEEMALAIEEHLELFDSLGCGRAKYAAQAAAYIRAFVARREKELGNG